MSTENDNNRDRMRHFAPGRSPGIEQAIEETEIALRNTADFLARLRESEENTQAYVRQVKEGLERTLKDLERKKETKDQSDP